MSKIKILVGIPMLTPGYEFFKALMKFQADVIRDGKYEIGFTTAYRQPTFLAQEEFAQLAIATESDYLLVMDDDIWNPSHVLVSIIESIIIVSLKLTST